MFDMEIYRKEYRKEYYIKNMKKLGTIMMIIKRIY